MTSTGNALDFAYGYDRNGKPVQIDDHVIGLPTSQHRTMTYDALDRLTTAVSPAFGGSDHTHRFGYDALDNLTSWTQAGVKDYAEYLYDARNRLTSIRNSSGATVVGLEYDPQGNLRNKNGQQFQFDAGNRLRGVSSGGTCLYDGLGRRVQTIQANGDTRLWQYGHGGQLLFAWSGPSQQKTHEYIYLAGSLLATIDHHWPSNLIIATRYQHTDALGSPVALSDELGTVVERHVYEPWGGIVGKPGYSGIGYTGHVMDGGTGLTYMQQRYYDQSLGRFLSVDPVEAQYAKNNFNRYVYARNNPYLYTDPDGRESPCITLNTSCGIDPSNFSKNMRSIARAIEFLDRELFTPLGPIGVAESKAAGPAAVFFRALAAENRIASRLIPGFTAAESSIIREARLILASSEMRALQAAHEAGRPASVMIGGRIIQYEPGMNASGMTMFGGNGFVVGTTAFKSSSELQKTVLHELHRLSTSASSSGLTAELAAKETKAAFEFAERAHKKIDGD